MKAIIYTFDRHPVWNYTKVNVTFGFPGGSYLLYALKPRLDLVRTQATYEWGRKGKGSLLLAVSLAADALSDLEDNRAVVNGIKVRDRFLADKRTNTFRLTQDEICKFLDEVDPKP